MNQRATIAAAAATLLTLTLAAAPAVAQEKEKCFGIAKAGQNDCANLSDSHAQDDLELRRLKKQKLKLKDQIATLEKRLVPDIPA